jgi:hypothetical protein
LDTIDDQTVNTAESIIITVFLYWCAFVFTFVVICATVFLFEY